MKKWTILILAMLMTSIFVGCGNAANNDTGSASETESAPKAEVASCEDILNQVWNTFEEDEKFAVIGGDMTHMVDGAAGNFDIQDVENLMYMLFVPEDQVSAIDEAASLIHAMNANTFTGGAFHVADTANVDAFADALKENIKNAQWMCGFPDTLNIFVINGEYVVSTFGNAEIMENFKTKMTEVFGESVVIVAEESLI